jgi:hypothetical protein
MTKRLTLVMASACLPAALFAALSCAGQDSQPAVKQQQDAKSQGPQGIVTGTVICSDNHHPARVAQVVLLSASGETSAHPIGAATDLDGKFAILHVPEGKYYVSAQFPGYLNPLSDFTESWLAGLSPEARKDFEAHQTSITVSAKEPADVSLELDRAAEIDGTVQYDDGSPAIGLHVDLKPKADTSPAATNEAPVATVSSSPDALQRFTDDRGHFRILGVAPGEYLVSVSVPVGTAEGAQRSPLVGVFQSSSAGELIVYSGGSLRASEAKTIKIDSTGGSTDAEITIPLSRLHSIRGQIKLKSTGEPPLAASVQLLYADNREVARMAIAPDGEFELPFIPEGAFILRAAAGAGPLPKMEPDADGETGDAADLLKFVAAGGGKPEDGTEVSVQVTGDLEGVTITVPDPATNKPAAAPETTEQAPGSTPPPANAPQ